MARKITFDDKVSLTTSPLPRANKCTAEDLNEIKEVVNANASTTIVTTANTNLNDYIENGVYYFHPNYTPVNIPTGTNGWLVVMRGNGDNVIKQLWSRQGTPDANDFQTYVRTKSNTWSSWQRLMVENDLFYKAGDSVTLNWTGGGILTTAATEIQFSIPLPKRIKSGVVPTISAGALYVRRPTGGYILQNVPILENNTVNLIVTENLVRILLVHNTTYSETNNIPVGIQVNGLKIDFSQS